MIKKVYIAIDKYRQLIPLLLLTILSIYTLITFVIGEFEINSNSSFILTYKHYLGFTSLIFNYLTYIYARKHFKIILGITLIIGLLNLINFTVGQITSSIVIGSLKIGCQPYILLISLITYILNYKSVNRIIGEYFGPSQEQAIQSREMYKEETINKFMEKYQSFTNEQLETIIKDKRFVSEAIEASKRILEQRNNI